MGATDRIDIFGVGCDRLDADDIVSLIVNSAQRGNGGWVVTPNVDILRQVVRDPLLAELVEAATLVVIDGAPLEWAGKLALREGVHRTAGASLVLPLAQAAAAVDVGVLLLGGRPGSSAQASKRMASEIPGLRVTEYCPPYGFEDDAVAYAEMLEAVRASAGGIVFCGFGFPKQERLMLVLSQLFPDTWFLGIGGTIDMLAGAVPRAPLWVQRAGFEWAFRLTMEPKRLARRYLVNDLPFAARLLYWALRERSVTQSGAVVASDLDAVLGLRAEDAAVATSHVGNRDNGVDLVVPRGPTDRDHEVRAKLGLPQPRSGVDMRDSASEAVG